MQVIVGSYSQADKPGIHVFEWDKVKSSFLLKSQISGINNPSYLSVTDRSIYAISENKEDDQGALHVYRKDSSNDIVKTEVFPFEGAGSCHVSTDIDEKNAFIANYGDGTLSVLNLQRESFPNKGIQKLTFDGKGPDQDRQDQSHLHAALLTKDQKYLYCTDLGSDSLYSFPYQPGMNDPLDTTLRRQIKLPPGSGPRSIVVSQDGRLLYLITELSAEVYVFDITTPPTTWLQRVSLIQEGYTGKLEGGDIQIHSNGKFLYATNRGDANEIVSYEIDPESGTIKFLQRTGAAGLSPRNLLLCESHGLLLVANEQSDNIAIFKMENDGMLEFKKQHLQVSCPTCIKILTYQ